MQEIVQYTQNLTVLYVEDNEETRSSTMLVLQRLFKNVIEAVDGNDGIAKYKDNQDNIDIIISDINMPHLNGLDMSKEILAINKDVPIFIFSAHNETNLFIEAIQIGIEGYLLKPLDMKQFLQALKKSIEKLQLQKENNSYKLSLEAKLQAQLEQLLLTEELLERNSKMAAMGEMIDIIAHQWKQPLNIISLQAGFLQECALDGEQISNDEIIQCSKKVISQIQHLLHTLNEFREFFRPTTNIKEINLTSLFNSLQVLLKDNLLKNNINISYDFDESIKFNFNENDIKHIFINLINNAKDAFIQNNIDIRNITIKATKLENKTTILFEDNAGGIPKHILPNIFKQNFTTKKDIGGTGIGLYMCKMILDKYNSTIDVETFDGGSRFIIVISE